MREKITSQMIFCWGIAAIAGISMAFSGPDIAIIILLWGILYQPNVRG